MPPLTLMIKPASGLCDLKCEYCFYADVSAHREIRSYGVMSVDTLETLVRRAFLYAESQLSFMFQGGEPTVAGKAFFRHFLKLEAEYKDRPVRVLNAIQTNGYALDEEWCEIFKEGSFLVGVSLDGTREIHDTYRKTADKSPTYDRIVKNIRLLEKAGVDYNILCVVNELIAARPKEVFHALAPHKWLQFIACIDPFGEAEKPWSLKPETYGNFLIETFDLYEQAYRNGDPVSIRSFDNWIRMLAGYPPESCGMSGRCGVYYLVEADGSVYPCDFYVLDKWCMGNVNELPFRKLEKSPVADAFRKESIPLPENCKDCKWLFLCRGGCKRDREPFINGLPSENRFCKSFRMFFDARYDKLLELSKEVSRSQLCGRSSCLS